MSATAAAQKNIIGNYRLEKTVGSGTYGKVKLAKHIITNEKFAVKIIDKSSISTQKQIARIQREIRFLKLLQHPNIVKVYEVFESPNQIFIVMEYIQGGELFDYIVAHKRIKEKEARVFYREILSAVDYCHRNGVIHRDLKPENLLLNDNKNMKIIDFGFGNIFFPDGLLDTFCGSPFYAAPEMILGKKYEGPEVDLWSLGVILFALLCGHLPFDDENIKELYKKISSGQYTIPSYISTEAKALIQRLITVDPKKRATLAEVLQHPWLNEGFVGPPENHLPKRPIITDFKLLDSEILTRMAAFGHTAEEVQKAFEADQTSGRPHTIRATYFLLQEMVEKEKRKSGLSASQTALSPTSDEKKTSVSSTLFAITEDHSANRAQPPATNIENSKNNFTSMPQFTQEKSRRASAFDTRSPQNSHQRATTDGPKTVSTQNLSPASGPQSAPVATGNNLQVPSIDDRTRRHSATTLEADSSERNVSDSDAGIKSLTSWFLNNQTTSNKQPAEIIGEAVRVLKEIDEKLTEAEFQSYQTKDIRRGSIMAIPPQMSKNAVVFRIEVGKVPKISMYGISFKRISGGVWNYKKICNRIVQQMNL